MLDTCERAHPVGDSRSTSCGETRRHHSRKDVLNVVCARERNLLETQYRFLPAVLAKNNTVFAHESALGYALLPAEPVHVWFCWSQRRGRRVICVQHRIVGFRLILENARLVACISFKPV